MPLTAPDIKLVKSQLMADVANGGGLPSGTVVVDNTMNNIFPGVTRVERAGGGVTARKVFVHPQSDDTAQYFDAHAFVGKAGDANAEMAIIPCDKFNETRADLFARLNDPYMQAGNEYQLPGCTSTRISAGQGSKSLLTFNLSPATDIALLRPELLDGNPVTLVGVDSSGEVVGSMFNRISAWYQFFEPGYYPDGQELQNFTYSLGLPLTDALYGAQQIHIYGIAIKPTVRCYVTRSPSAAAALNATSISIDPSVAVFPKRGALDPSPALFGAAGLVKATYLDHTGASHTDPAGIAQDGYLRAIYTGDSVVIREGAAESMHSVIAVDYALKKITIYPPLPNAITTAATVSSVLPMGDLSAYVGAKFSQETWTGAWSDELTGNAAAAGYDSIGHPIAISNKGAITERWAIRFTGTDTVSVIGESVGVVASGLISADISPINPASGTPYFTLNAAGWGSGWNYDNVLRFNTVSAARPFWLWRCVHPGVSAVSSDTVKVEVRGEVDA